MRDGKYILKKIWLVLLYLPFMWYYYSEAYAKSLRRFHPIYRVIAFCTLCCAVFRDYMRGEL